MSATDETLDEMLAQQQRRRDIARLGACAMHTQHDAREVASRSLATRLRRYEAQIDPTGELKRRDPQALAKRVESALAEEMARVRLARADVKKRRAAYAAAQMVASVAAAERACSAMREAITTHLLQTPPDDIPQLAIFILALQALDDQPFKPLPIPQRFLTSRRKTQSAQSGEYSKGSQGDRAR